MIRESIKWEKTAENSKLYIDVLVNRRRECIASKLYVCVWKSTEKECLDQDNEATTHVQILVWCTLGSSVKSTVFSMDT